MSATPTTAEQPEMLHTVAYDDDWRILRVDRDRYELEFRDPAMRRWHTMYVAATEMECEAAYDAYHEGGTPVDSDYWP